MPTTPGSTEFRPVPVPEHAPVPEKAPDASLEQPAPVPERAPSAPSEEPQAPAPAPVMPATPTLAPAAPKDQEQMRIERRLEENLWEIYRALDARVRDRFKSKGEEVAVELRAAIGTPKMKPRFVLGLILGWLRLIPKVNKFFLSQEAKVKTDNVLEIDREYREKNGLL